MSEMTASEAASPPVVGNVPAKKNWRRTTLVVGFIVGFLGLVSSIVQIWTALPKPPEAVAAWEVYTEDADVTARTNVADQSIVLEHESRLVFEPAVGAGPHRYLLFINGDGRATVLDQADFDAVDPRAKPAGANTPPTDGARRHAEWHWLIRTKPGVGAAASDIESPPTGTFLLVASLQPVNKAELSRRVTRIFRDDQGRPRLKDGQPLVPDLKDTDSKLQWHSFGWKRISDSRQPTAPVVQWPDQVLEVLKSYGSEVGGVAVSGWTFNIKS